MRHFAVLSTFILAGAASAFASIDNGLLSLVPPGAKIIGAIDVARARNSDFGQFLLNKTQNEDVHFQEMIQETGFDPRRDLKSILFTGSGSESKTQPSAFAILARGTFDQSRIRASATTKGGATLVTYGGVDIIVHAKEAAGHQTAIAFLDGGVAAMGDMATLKQIIDGRAAPTILDNDLKSKINSIGANNDAWFVSLVGPSFLAGHSGQQNGADSQARALQGVVQSSGGVKFGSLIETTFDAVTRSDKDATSLSDVIRFFGSMVQMQRDKDPRAGILASAIDGMTLQSTGSAVHFAISLPEKSLEQLAESGAPVGIH